MKTLSAFWDLSVRFLLSRAEHPATISCREKMREIILMLILGINCCLPRLATKNDTFRVGWKHIQVNRQLFPPASQSAMHSCQVYKIGYPNNTKQNSFSSCLKFVFSAFIKGLPLVQVCGSIFGCSLYLSTNRLLHLKLQETGRLAEESSASSGTNHDILTRNNLAYLSALSNSQTKLAAQPLPCTPMGMFTSADIYEIRLSNVKSCFLF